MVLAKDQTNVDIILQQTHKHLVHKCIFLF